MRKSKRDIRERVVQLTKQIDEMTWAEAVYRGVDRTAAKVDDLAQDRDWYSGYLTRLDD